jgi:hypothetical protein
MLRTFKGDAKVVVHDVRTGNQMVIDVFSDSSVYDVRANCRVCGAAGPFSQARLCV